MRTTSSTLSSGSNRSLVATVVVLAALSYWLAPADLSAAELPKDPEKLAPAQAVDAYLAVLEDPGQSNLKRNYAGERIAKMGEAALPRISELWRDASLERRGYLATVLSAMKGCRGGETLLLENLKEQKLAVHENVIRALGDLQAREASKPLLDLLPEARDGVRQVVLYALARIAEPEAADALFSACEDPDRVIRATVSDGIVRILQETRGSTARGTASAYDRVFKQAMKYIEEGKRADARTVLIAGAGTLGDEHACFSLRRVLRKEQTDLRCAAAEALGALKCADAVDELLDLYGGENETARRIALKALAAVGDERCVPALIEKLLGEPPEGRKDLVKALQQVTGQTYGDNPRQWQIWWNSRPR